MAKKKKKSLSRHQKPENLTLEDWQVALRRDYGRQQEFYIRNIGADQIFSEFHVTNPKSGNTYRVAIRGSGLGENYCSCPDFATNHLGTCKHIEWTLARLERKKGGQAALEEGFLPAYSEVFLQYGSQRVVRFQPGSDCPMELVEASTEYFDDRGVLREKAFSTVDQFLELGDQSDHDFRYYDDTLLFIAEKRDDKLRRRRLKRIFAEGLDSSEFDELLRVPLYRYQKEGALFAAEAGRSLIGDEMGLGKTIQAIAAVEILTRHFGIDKVLIICPTSLKHQWEREIERFSTRDVCVVNGLFEKRRELYHSEGFYKITNYDVIHRDLSEIQEWEPDLVILDEAQRIKNWETRTAQSVKKVNSPYCIVLTGTPLENRLEELVSLVQFIDQHRLGPTYRFLHEHQQHDDNGRVIGYRNLSEVGQTLEPILLRRRKSQVLDELPERLEKQYFLPMTPEQMEVHQTNQMTVAKITQKWRRHRFLAEADRRRLMVALQYMRMVCDSTFLVDQETDSSVKPDELITVLEELLEDPETKVVIFSQWVRMQQLIIQRVEEKGWGHVFFHGSVRSEKRKELVEQFRDDPECRLFLATDAGGVGLNLQMANVVVNLDLPWNPAVLEQRIGRVHRLGQTQPVQVINFISEGTIESSMLNVLKFKQSVFEGVLDDGESDIFLESGKVGSFMETVEQVNDSIPKAPPAPPEPKPATDPEPAPAADPTPSQKAMAGLLENGLALLKQLANASKAATEPKEEGDSKEPKQNVLFGSHHDEETGEVFLKLPVPDTEKLSQVIGLMQELLQPKPPEPSE